MKNSKNYFKDIFLFFDLLSPEPKLRVNSKSSYKTFFGSMLSIAIILITIIAIFYFGMELFSKNEPVAVISAKDYESMDFGINSNEYNIFLGVEDSKFVYYNDPSIFTLTAYHKNITLDSEGNESYFYQDLEIKTCDNYYESSNSLKNGLDRSIFYCLKPNQVRIQGYWGYKVNSFAGIVLSKCTNTTENSNFCKPIEEINKKIAGGVFSLYSQNNLLNINNFQTPLTNVYDDIFYSLNLDFTFTLFIALRSIEFVTDSGFILQNLQTISTYFANDPHILYYGKRDPIIADIIIQSKPLGQKVNRSYIKFQDFLTKMGGLIKAITMLGSLLIQFTSYIEFYNDYINNLFVREHAIKEHMIDLQKLDTFKINSPLDKKKHVSKDKAIKNESSNFSSLSIDERNQASKTDKTYKSPIHLKLNNFLKNQSKPKNEEDLTRRRSKISFKKMFTGMSQSNYNYPTCKAFKEFFIQMCPCFKNNNLKKFKNNIELKMDKSLSIEIMIEKFYMIEVLSAVALTESQQVNAYNMYVELLKKPSSKMDPHNIKIFEIKKEQILE